MTQILNRAQVGVRKVMTENVGRIIFFLSASLSCSPNCQESSGRTQIYTTKTCDARRTGGWIHL